MAHFLIKKFDVVVMNPPYNNSTGNKGTGNTLWDKFVIKTLNNLLIKDGYLVAVHPSGWRNVHGTYKNIQILLKNLQIQYLEIHNEKDGLKIFGATTRYDFYCVKNTYNQGNFITKIKCQGGFIERANICKLEFIPNGMFSLLNKLIAKNDEQKVEVIHSESIYAHRKTHMLQESKDNYILPCIYTIGKNDKIKLWFSSIKLGHFGVPKLIWSNGRIISVGSVIDNDGKYGLMEYCSAIVDKSENLSNIKKAFDSKLFRDLMECCAISDMSINRRVIALFRKDFWVDFLDYNNDD